MQLITVKGHSFAAGLSSRVNLVAVANVARRRKVWETETESQEGVKLHLARFAFGILPEEWRRTKLLRKRRPYREKERESAEMPYTTLQVSENFECSAQRYATRYINGPAGTDVR